MAEIKTLTAEYYDHLRDESRVTGEAELIAFAKNEADVQELLAFCQRERLAVTIQAGRTGISAAAVPHGGLVLDISQMDHIVGLRYDEKQQCFFIRLEPGVSLISLRKALLNKAFTVADWDEQSKEALAYYQAGAWFFPTDPTESSALLGGIVACNASGARSFFYGPVRPYVEQLRLILVNGDSLTIKRGSVYARGCNFSLTTDQGHVISGDLPAIELPAVKNAAGYYIKEDMDLIDLFIGGEGTLAIITEIELRLLPNPAHIWGITCFLGSEEQAVSLVRAIRGERLQGMASYALKPAAIEFFNAAALNILRQQKAENPAFAAIQELKPEYRCAVYCEFHLADREEGFANLEILAQLLTELGADAEATWVASSGTELDKLIFFRHAVPESVNMLIDQRRRLYPQLSKLGTDMAVPDQYLGRVMEMYGQDLKAAGLEQAAWGHIGDNHLHVNILPRNPDDYRLGKELYRRWAEQVSAWGGTVSAEHGVGKLKAPYLRLMYGGGVDAMFRLKLLFDRYNLLNTGNLFAEE